MNEKLWKCQKCGHESEQVLICLAEDNGKIVDLIDYWCEKCGSSKVLFMGTDEQRNEYFDNAMDREES